MTEKNSPFEEEPGNMEADVKYDDVIRYDDVLKSISKAIDPSALLQFQVNTGGNWNTFDNVNGYRDDYVNEEAKTYEFKLVDGTKTMKTMSYRDIKNIVEFSTSRLRFSWKFPFFRKETRRITHVDFTNDPRSLDVDCNISMFMTILGRQYVSWNKALMTESVKRGTNVN